MRLVKRSPGKLKAAPLLSRAQSGGGENQFSGADCWVKAPGRVPPPVTTRSSLLTVTVSTTDVCIERPQVCVVLTESQ